MAIHPSYRYLNQLLAALPAADWAALQPHLEWVEMPQDAVLCESGEVLQHLYFPVTAVVSLVSLLKNGDTAEVAVVGSEGMVGVWAFLGGAAAQTSAVVQCAGYGLRMPAGLIAELAQGSPALSRQLLSYTQALIMQMTQTSVCNRHHSVDQQLCRWLLLVLDRQSDLTLHVTHERIANMLGVRREGITGGALKLRKAGLIDYERGCLSVLNRRGLEARSCECYSVVRKAYGQWPAAPVAQLQRPADAPVLRQVPLRPARLAKVASGAVSRAVA